MIPHSNEQASNSSSIVGTLHGDTKRIAVMFNWLLSLNIAVLLPTIFITYGSGNLRVAIILSACLPILIIAYALVHRRAFELTTVFISVTFLTLVTAVSS